jgi:hypothetical protein
MEDIRTYHHRTEDDDATLRLLRSDDETLRIRFDRRESGDDEVPFHIPRD